MTFETLFENLKEAQYSVSMAAHQMEMANSMATARPCALVEKSISAYERAIEAVNDIRAEMCRVYDSDLLAMDIRCGRK